MQLGVSISNSDNIVSVDVADDMALGDLRAYLEAETGISPAHQRLLLDGNALNGDDRPLKELGLKNSDLLSLSNTALVAPTPIRAQGHNNGAATTDSPVATAEAAEKVELIRQQLISNPILKQQFPPQIDDLINDPQQFRDWFQTYVANDPFGRSFRSGASSPASAARNAELQRLQQDPDNPENQKKILELIQQEQIDENMRNALEYSPETFATVSMLYVDVELNGHKVKAFVDTGAQRTILSSKLAGECGLSRLIDKRFRGQAFGVGSGEIKGQIHTATIKISQTFFPCSFTILDTNVDFLLGLDMLKRHRGVVDLNKNCLVFGEEETPFLPESEIPDNIFKKNGPKTATKGAGQLGNNLFHPENAIDSSAKKRNATETDSSRPHRYLNKYPESMVQQLQGLGFSREKVIKALDETNGNADFAAALLFQ